MVVKLSTVQYNLL